MSADDLVWSDADQLGSRIEIVNAAIPDVPNMSDDELQEFVRSVSLDVAVIGSAEGLSPSLVSAMGYGDRGAGTARGNLARAARSALCLGLIELDRRSGRTPTAAERAGDVLAKVMDVFSAGDVIRALDEAGLLNERQVSS